MSTNLSNSFLQEDAFEQTNFLDEEKLFKERWENIGIHLNVAFVKRELFNKKKWIFLVENKAETIDKQKDGEVAQPASYTLYLPDNLKVYEIPKIIKKLNSETFKGELPKRAANYETQVYILQTFIFLYENKDKYDNKSYKKALKNYYQFFVTYFWDEKTPWLKSIENIKNLLLRVYEEQALSKQNKDDISSLKREIKNSYSSRMANYNINLENTKSIKEVHGVFADKLKTLMEEAVLEYGTKKLSDYMTIFTQQDYEDAKLKDDKNLRLKTSKESLGKAEEKIKKAVNFENAKAALKKLRESWDEDKISSKELEIMTLLIQEVYKFPRLRYTYHLDKILDDNYTQCLLKTILSHVFLQELGIIHTTLDIKQHIAIIAYTQDGKKYYFDAEFNKKLINLDKAKYIKKNWDYTILSDFEIWDYDTSWSVDNNRIFAFRESNPEEGILSALFFNRGNAVETPNGWQFISELKKSISLDPKNCHVHNALAKNYILLGLLKKAQYHVDKSLESNPRFAWAYLTQAKIYIKTGKYDKALEQINISQKIDTHDYTVDLLKGTAYLYKNQLKMAEQFLEKYLASTKGINKEGIFRLSLNVAHSYFSSWFYDKAILYYEKILDKDKDKDKDKERDKNSFFNNLWLCYLYKKEYLKAKQYLSKEIKLDGVNNYNVTSYVFNNRWVVSVYLSDFLNAKKDFCLSRQREQREPLSTPFDLIILLSETYLKKARNAYLYKNIWHYFFYLAISKKNLDGSLMTKKSQKKYYNLAKQFYENSLQLPLYQPNSAAFKEVVKNLKKIEQFNQN